jgi:excisionase family DNA binding protein
MQMKMYEPEITYISVSDAAQRLGVTRQRVHQLLNSGGLTGLRTGHVHLVRRRDVENRLEKLKRQAEEV